MSPHALTLMTWFSPAFPVGAFAYSHGLEWAHEAGDVPDAARAEGWLCDILEHGAGRNDAILMAEAWRGTAAGDMAAAAAIAELGVALAASASAGWRRRRRERLHRRRPRLLALRGAGRLPGRMPGDTPYPVAVGVAAAGHGVPLEEALPAFLLAFAANLVSAAVRLGAVGQTDGQRVLARLSSLAARQAEACGGLTLDDLGSCAFRSDLASLRHETQYSRLFRS